MKIYIYPFPSNDCLTISRKLVTNLLFANGSAIGSNFFLLRRTQPLQRISKNVNKNEADMSCYLFSKII